jgi:rubrerythrin
MKFHALALCLAGTLAACGAASAQSNYNRDQDMTRGDRTTRARQERMDRMREDRMSDRDRDRMSDRDRDRDRMSDQDRRDWDRRYEDRMGRDGAGRGMSYSEWYYRTWDAGALHLTDPRHTAEKVRNIIHNQEQEAAELRSIAPQARTSGYENISTVYERMADDHTQLASFGMRWLNEHGMRGPASPDVQPSAMAPAETVEHQLQMHIEHFNKALADRQNEPSETVRGMLLWGAATAARHISILRTLNQDVAFGRKSLSARLNMLLDTGYMASNQSELMARIEQEEYEMVRQDLVITRSTTVVEAIPPAEVIQPEAPAPVVEVVPAPQVVQAQPVRPTPVIVRPETSNVAGARQTTVRRTVRSTRVRRPAY